MRITTKCKIAVNALLDIAAHVENGYAISLPIVSKRLAVSDSYLELIFSNLKRAGLINSHRGPGGGYYLAKNPGMISIKDIVDATGAPQPLEGGLGAQLWINLGSYMQDQMAQITLSYLLDRSAIRIEPSLEHLGLKLENLQKVKVPKASVNKKSATGRKSLGPNSVFSFGRYLLHEE